MKLLGIPTLALPLAWALASPAYAAEPAPAPAAPPAVTAIDPPFGCTHSTITIKGSGFRAGAQVKVGGLSCANAKVVSAQEITCMTPVRAPGPADVTVINPDAQEATLSKAFIFYIESVFIHPGAAVSAVGAGPIAFRAYGGAPPYAFSMASGVGSVDEKNGIYSAPAQAGQDVVRATDLFGNFSDAVVTVNPALAITPAERELATGETTDFSVSGGVGPYTLNVSGSGTISQFGRYQAPLRPAEDTVQVKDSLGGVAQAKVKVNLTLAIEPAELTIAANGTYEFSAKGGTRPYAFTISSGNASIDQATGRFSAGGVPGDVVVRVTDAGGNPVDAKVKVVDRLTIDPNSKIIAVENAIAFKSSGGVAPVKFSVASGAGQVSEESGDFTAGNEPGLVTVAATDANGTQALAEITVNSKLTISPLEKVIAVNKATMFFATGGVPPYAFSVERGEGEINKKSGRYVAPGVPGTATVRVTDSYGNTSDALVTITLPEDMLAVGHQHSCSLVGGKVKCWGDNERGQLGNNTNIDSLEAVQVQGMETGVKQLVGGQYHDCALKDGGVKCWGFNVDGQLGDGTHQDRSIPVQVQGLEKGVKMISSGQFHTCALLDTSYSGGGEVRCWGKNDHGQLGDDSQQSSQVPVPVKGLSSGVRSIAAGIYHTCALLEKDVVCWGDNRNWQLGNRSSIDWKVKNHSLVPIKVRGLKKEVTTLVAGGFHSCVLADGDVLCWGDNAFGQLGDGTRENHIYPAKVRGLGKEVQGLFAGAYHTCAILNGGAKCWGQNVTGQLGTGSTKNQVFPASVSGLSCGVDAIGPGTYHSCAIILGTLKCWGRNGDGQLGDSTRKDSLVPVTALPPSRE